MSHLPVCLHHKANCGGHLKIAHRTHDIKQGGAGRRGHGVGGAQLPRALTPRPSLQVCHSSLCPHPQGTSLTTLVTHTWSASQALRLRSIPRDGPPHCQAPPQVSP